MKSPKRYLMDFGPKKVLLGLIASLIGFLLALEAIPTAHRLFYDRFLWKSIVGPILADWKGHPVTYHNLTAYAGYNLINTVVYALLGLSIFYSIYRLLAKYDIKLDKNFFFSALPLIAFGGLARAGEDLGITGSLGPLFITPIIYFIIAGWALCLIFISHKTKRDLNGLLLASGLMLIVLYSAFFLLTAPSHSPKYHYEQLGTILVLAILPTAALYALGRLAKTEMLVKTSYLTILFGHLLDASQSYVGMHSGYTEKMVLPNLITSLTGPYAIFLLKLSLVLPILYLLDKETEANRIDANFGVLFMLAVLSLGLPQGIRGAARIILGV